MLLNRLAMLMLASSAASASGEPVATPVQDITDPLTVASPVDAEARPVPVADLSAVRGLAGAVWAPDGKSVVISSNITGRFNLWRVDLGQSFPVQLTVAENAQIPVEITADNRVLFLQDTAGDELYDLFSVPLAGGAVENLTRTPAVAEMNPRLSPDGRSIVYSRREETASVIDLAVLELATGTVRQITHEADPTRDWWAVGFADGGRTLIATRGEVTGSRAASYRIDLASGQATALTTEASGVIAEASAVSPDGTLVSLTSNEETGQSRAGFMDLRDGRVVWLKDTPWEQTGGAFSKDGRTFVVQTNADGRADLSLVDVATAKERALPFPPGDNAVGSDQPWRADGRLLVLRNGADSPANLWMVDPGTGQLDQITRLALASLESARLPKSHIVAYKSADGTPISAILTLPFNLERDGTAPAVVIAHGGPTGQAKDSFSRLATLLASNGYLVIQPNFRGSTGYGAAFQRANVKDLGGGDLDDVVAGAEFLAATGYVDPARIGITGGSYGGFMTLMALGKRPDVFAAGVNQFGIINWFSMWDNAVGGLREYQRGLVGDPVADKEAYERQSPMTYASNIRAPLLNLQGENDVRVPRGQTDEVVRLVRAEGGVVEAVYYPGEGHGLDKLENQEDSRRRILEWFDRYLKRAE